MLYHHHIRSSCSMVLARYCVSCKWLHFFFYTLLDGSEGQNTVLIVLVQASYIPERPWHGLQRSTRTIQRAVGGTTTCRASQLQLGRPFALLHDGVHERPDSMPDPNPAIVAMLQHDGGLPRKPDAGGGPGEDDRARFESGGL